MMRSKPGLFVLLLLLTGCSDSSDSGVLGSATRFYDMSQDIQIDGADGVSIEEALDHYDVHGASVIVIDEGSTVLLQGHYGFEDRDAGIETSDRTLYPAASLSKFVAGLGMARAARLHSEFGLARKVSRTATDHPSSFVAGWVNSPLRSPVDRALMGDISVRRLMKNVAGLDRPLTGVECATPSEETGLDDILDPLCLDCLNVKSVPGTEWSYSSGGFALAEAILLAETGRSAKEMLETEVLDPLGLDRSSFADATTSTPYLSRCCDDCSCEVAYADVKFPGGMLAHPLEYATLLRYVLDDGMSSDGNVLIHADDLHEVLKPAQNRNSSNRACSDDSDCYNPLVPGEVCHTGACIRPLETGQQESSGSEAGGWYGMGVHLSPDTDVGGYSRILHHSGGHNHPGTSGGVSTYFNVDRLLENGIVIMVNGGPKDGRTSLRADIIDAFERHYR